MLDVDSPRILVARRSRKQADPLAVLIENFGQPLCFGFKLHSEPDPIFATDMTGHLEICTNLELQFQQLIFRRIFRRGHVCAAQAYVTNGTDFHRRHTLEEQEDGSSHVVARRISPVGMRLCSIGGER